jgi:hypothetical protein
MANDPELAQQPQNDQQQEPRGPSPISVARYIKTTLQLIAYLGGVLALYVFRPAANNAATTSLVVLYACVTVVCLVILAVLHNLLEKAAWKYSNLLVDFARRRREAEEEYMRSREAFRDHYHCLADIIIGELTEGDGKTIEDLANTVSTPWGRSDVVTVLGILFHNTLV